MASRDIVHFVLVTSLCSAFAADARAAVRGDDQIRSELQALVNTTFAQLADDPHKAAAHFQFSKPGYGQSIVPSLGTAIGEWHKLRCIPETKNWSIRHPIALTLVNFPPELPVQLADATLSVDGNSAVLEGEEGGIRLSFLNTPDGWKWDGAAHFGASDDRGAKWSAELLLPLAAAIGETAKEIRDGVITGYAEAALAIDRRTCLSLLAGNLTDSAEAPVPKRLSGERRIAERLGRLSSLAVTSDGKFALTGATTASQPLRFWDLTAGKLLRPMQFTTGGVVDVHAIALSSDGKRAVVQGVDVVMDDLLRSFSEAKPYDQAGQIPAVWLFDLESGREIRRFTGEYRELNENVAFSADAKLVASSGVSHTYVWDAESGELKYSLPSGDAATFAPGGDLVVLQTLSIKVFDMATGKERHGFPLSQKQPDRTVSTIAVSPDGSLIAYGTITGTILCDSQSGKITRRLKLAGGGVNRVNTIGFSRDGKRALTSCGLYSRDDGANAGLGLFASGERLLCLYDVDTGQRLKKIGGYQKTVSSAVFIEGEQSALATSTDGTLRVWDLR